MSEREALNRIADALEGILACMRATAVESQDSDQRLDALIDAWNSLPKEIATPVKARRTEAILQGWRRVQKADEAREWFDNPVAIAGMIRASKFCHAKGWFRLPWLFQKGKTGEWNILKLMEGAYQRGEFEKEEKTPDADFVLDDEKRQGSLW